MDLIIRAQERATFQNAKLDRATKTIYKLSDGIKKNMFAVAAIIASVDAEKSYEQDGFANVHEWVTKTFGFKKSNSYELLKIGKEYTRAILNEAGTVKSYQSNLVELNAANDFTTSQVQAVLPLGHDKAAELVNAGEITPEMSVRDIKKVVKENKEEKENSKRTENAEAENEPETAEAENGQEETEAKNEPETVEVKAKIINYNGYKEVVITDNEGAVYEIPLDILKQFEI